MRDKEIAYVGDTKAIQEFIGPNTEVIDLAGKMLLPGFIDSHAHHASATINDHDSVMLYHLDSMEAYVSAVKAFAEKHPRTGCHLRQRLEQ